MKNIFTLLALSVSVIASASCGTGGWVVSRDGSNVEYAAKVPSTVAGTLVENGVKPEKSMFDTPWWYRKELRISKEAGKHYFLKFEGVNYRADIWFAGKQIAASDTTFGVFRNYEYDITPLVTGKDRLEVKLQRAQKGDLNIGFVDWNPRPEDESMGLWRDVTLRAVGDVKMDDVFVKPILDVESLAEADIELSMTLTNLADKDITAAVTGMFEGKEFCVPVNLPAGAVSELVLTKEQVPAFHVENPRIWWCNGCKEFTGLAELYDISLSAYVEGGISDSQDVRFGIRSITAELDEAGHRSFSLNGRKVLIKGAGWTDDRYLLDTHEDIETQIRYVQDMNLNCVRFENIWGKDRFVYDMCDKYGLLAFVGWSCQWEWEDYCGLPEVGMFGCISTPELQDLVVDYFTTQVKWLRNNPSVCGWMVGSDRIPAPALEKRYLEAYAALDYRPYVCSAKSLTSEFGGLSGTKMEGPYEYVAPDYWYRDVDCGGAFGFNTETGIGANMPQIQSIRQMIPSDKLWPVTNPEWSALCTSSSSAMNTLSVLTEVMNAQYGEATSLEDYIKKAHAIDYDGTRAMFDSFRANLPNTTGIVQWMLNSACNSVYWQLYDHNLVPTAGYYGTRKACKPVQFIYNYADRCLYAVNETGAMVNSSVHVRVYDENSVLLEDKKYNMDIADRTPLKVCSLESYEGRPVFLSAGDNFYCIPSSLNTYNWKKANWYITPISKYADLRFVTDMPKAKVSFDCKTAVEDGERVYTVTLRNESDVLAYQNILALTDASGRMIEPASWSDNFVTILPRETMTITCRVSASAPSGKVSLSTWNSVEE